MINVMIDAPHCMMAPSRVIRRSDWLPLRTECANDAEKKTTFHYVQFLRSALGTGEINQGTRVDFETNVGPASLPRPSMYHDQSGYARPIFGSFLDFLCTAAHNKGGLWQKQNKGTSIARSVHRSSGCSTFPFPERDRLAGKLLLSDPKIRESKQGFLVLVVMRGWPYRGRFSPCRL
jgi:hypothetical protein